MFTLNDLNTYDPYIIRLIKKIFPCDNSYLNKCKSSKGLFFLIFLKFNPNEIKDIELGQKIKLGESCKYDESVAQSIYARKTLLPTRIQTSSNNKISRGLTSTESAYFSTFTETSRSTILPSTSILNKNEQLSI